MMSTHLTRQLRWRIPIRVVATSVLVGALAACGPGPICGGSSSSQFAKMEDQAKAVVTGIDFLIVSRPRINGTIYPVEESAELLPKELRLRVSLSYEFPQLTESTQRWFTFDWLVSSAYACSRSYAEPEFSSKISNADLVSSASMGPSLPAGSSLASGFIIESDSAARNTDASSDAPPQTPLDEFGAPEPVTASQLYTVTVPTTSTMQLVPEVAQDHRFTFSITLEDGQSFSATSKDVRILPPT